MKRVIPVLILTVLLVSPTKMFAADADDRVIIASVSTTTVPLTAPPPTRPQALPALYAGLAGLQAYDGYATLRGVHNGASEMNPLVGGLATQPAAFWSLKAASTAVSIYLAEQYWREGHRTKAVVTMVAANALMAAVAGRNSQILAGR